MSEAMVPTYDVIVVGSGAAGLTAAVTAAHQGASALVLEASPLVGGTTAISGGMAWLPGSSDHGDSPEAARLYLDRAAPSPPNAVRETFLARATEAREWLSANTALKLVPVPTYPDYEPDLPGAMTRGRCFEAVPFDGVRLGPWFKRLRPPLPEFMLLGGMMVSRADLPHFRRVFRNVKSTAKVAKLALGYASQRLRQPRGTTLYLGNALVARLLESALDAGVVIRTDARVVALVSERDTVTGVEIQSGGAQERVLARRGVILGSGGFSHDRELRLRHLPVAAQSVTANVPSQGPPGARLAGPLGAGVDESAANRAFWVPGSVFGRGDGTDGVFPHTVTDRGKPGLIAVDTQGRRFVNEARSYHHFVMAMLARSDEAADAYLICDAAFLWNYGLGRVRPFRLSLKSDRESGYLVEARTIGALAERLGIPGKALEDTVARYNASAEKGEDPDFGRGGDAYQRHLGDAAHQPNPCVAPLRKPPFYAVRIHPADLGTAAGLRTDETARVLDRTGMPIHGLYACGNDMNSVMAGAYPGPGITLGPALTFGYIAGRDAAAR